MLRTDAVLLVLLAARRHPERRAALRVLLGGLGDDESSAGVGQRLIRAKLVAPQEFVALQGAVERAHRRCGGCKRELVCFAGRAPRRRRCRCGHANVISPTSDEAADLGRRERGRAGRSSGKSAALPRPRTSSGKTAALSRRRSQPKLIGKYTILDRIGDGGMGVIFRAVEPESGRVVALKLLRSGISGSTEERFRREAEAVARLSHPAIVRVHDVGTDERGRPFFTMDYVEGRELKDVLPSLERRALLALMAELCDGLHHAHESGIIHRDIKPQNILVDLEGRPRLADFGLARDLGRSSLTEEGDVIGTPLFMAPEQLRGDPDAIDRRTDVYALGVLLYQGLTGKLPIEAGSFLELQRRITSVKPAAPSEVAEGIPVALDRIVLRALAKDPDERQETAAELARELREHLARDESGTGSGSSSPSDVLWSARRRLGQRWILSGLGALALLLGLGALLLHLREVRAREDRAREDLELRRASAQTRLQEARDALARARDELERGDVSAARASAEDAARTAEAAGAEARALGRDAPTDVTVGTGEVATGARRIRALALARDPSTGARREALALLRADAPASRDVVARLTRGALELEVGRTGDALRLFNAVLAQEPDAADAYLLRAETHRRAGEPRFALADYDQALARRDRLTRSPVEALVGRARCRLALEDPEAAASDLAEAARAAPDEPLVSVGRAALHAQRDEGDLALDVLEHAAGRFPGHAGVQEAYGRAAAHAGRGDAARAALDRAISLSLDPSARLARARLRSLRDDDEGALGDLRDALAQLGPTDPLRAELELARTRLLRTRGQLDEALAALGALGDTRRIREERAELQLGLGALDAAERAFEGLIAQEPDDIRALRGGARLALRRRDPPLVRARVTRLLARYESDPDGLATDAISSEQVVADHPEEAYRARTAAAHAQRAALIVAPGLPLEVGDPLADALALRGEARRLLDADGVVNREARLSALRLLERALRLAPWLWLVRVEEADALALLGQPDRARAELKLVLDEVPGLEEAVRAQERLRR